MGTEYFDIPGGQAKRVDDAVLHAALRSELRKRIKDNPKADFLFLAESLGARKVQLVKRDGVEPSLDDRTAVKDIVVRVDVAGETFHIPMPDIFNAVFDVEADEGL